MKETYETSQRGELRAPHTATLSRILRLTFLERCMCGVKQFSNRIRKTAAKRSCLRLRWKSSTLAEIMGAALNATRQLVGGFAAASLLFGWSGCKPGDQLP